MIVSMMCLGDGLSFGVMNSNLHAIDSVQYVHLCQGPPICVDVFISRVGE